MGQICWVRRGLGGYAQAVNSVQISAIFHSNDCHDFITISLF